MEVLVMAGILGVIGYMLSGIVVSSLGGGQKSNLIGNIKDNGQSVINVMSGVIRNSDRVVCMDTTPLSPSGTTSGDVITFYTHDGHYVRFRYEGSRLFEDFPDQLSGSGGIPYVVIYATAPDPAEVNKICQTAVPPSGINPVPTPGPGGTSQTSLTDPVSGVAVDKTGGGAEPVFILRRSPGSKDSVTIQFDLSQGTGAAGSYQSELGGSGKVSFQTTVELR